MALDMVAADRVDSRRKYELRSLSIEGTGLSKGAARSMDMGDADTGSSVMEWWRWWLWVLDDGE